MDAIETILAIAAFVLVVLIALAVFIGPVLAIIALRRTRQVIDLRDEVGELHRRLRVLEAGRSATVVDVLPAREKPAVAATAEPARARQRPRPVQPARDASRETVRIESFIGRRVLAWIAAGLLVLAAAFFLNYALQSGMIGPAGQVSIAALVAAALCAWGFRQYRRGDWIIYQILTGTGTVLLFFAIYAAFALYPLLTAPAAGIYLAILMGEAALLAVLYRSRVIAFLSIIGALLTPILISEQGDPFLVYFAYLLVLNVAVQGIFALRPWVGMRTLALVGTQGLFWIWFLHRYHPDKHHSVVIFQVLLAAVFLAPDWLAAVRRAWSAEDWALQVILPWFLFVTLHRVLGELYPSWMGSLALLMAIVWTLFVVAASHSRFVRDPVRPLVYLGTALAFLGLSFPLQAKAYWATLGWAAEGVALWWLGLRIQNRLLRWAGVVFLLLATFGAIDVMSVYAPEYPYDPIVNRRTLTVLVVAAALFATAWAARVFKDCLELVDQVVRYATGLTGVVLVWLVLSFEVWDSVRLFATDEDSMIPHTALSFAWALYAGALLAIGFRLQHSPTRWTALGLLSVTILKLLFYDLSELGGVYRVLTFLVGAIVLAAAAAAYRRVRIAHAHGIAESSND